MVELGVNIDHVATLREARKGAAPDLVAAAKICEIAGAHQITIHLRADRRHIQDRDAEILAQCLQVRLNFEMSIEEEIVQIAERIKPHTVCLVPENRQEITTEGGLDVASKKTRLAEIVKRMHDQGTKVSMFIDPEPAQIDASAALGADYCELHTGAYANARGAQIEGELERLYECGEQVCESGMAFHGGHGLTVRNLAPIARIPGLREVNIGHDIIARSIFIGLDAAVKEILDILDVESELAE